MTDRVVIGLTGATGQIYGIRALELLQEEEIEVHLVMSDAAKMTITQEEERSITEIADLATEIHDNRNIGATIASGSFDTNGMLIAPCSMKTLSNIATGNAETLVARAADVMLKERRQLILLPREKPFHRIHLKNMLEVTDAGAIVTPPFPSYYQKDLKMDEMVTRTMARALSYIDSIEIDIDEWRGLGDPNGHK